VIIEGRSDLSGPLSQLYLDGDGTWYVVAAGRANHAGRGSYAGLVGNYYWLGVEAEDGGDGYWLPEQLEAYRAGTVAILRYTAWQYLCGHKEYALPPGRKVDPAGLDMDHERRVCFDLARRPVLVDFLEDLMAQMTDDQKNQLLADLHNTALATVEQTELLKRVVESGQADSFRTNALIAGALALVAEDGELPEIVRREIAKATEAGFVVPGAE